LAKDEVGILFAITMDFDEGVTIQEQQRRGRKEEKLVGQRS